MAPHFFLLNSSFLSVITPSNLLRVVAPDRHPEKQIGSKGRKALAEPARVAIDAA